MKIIFSDSQKSVFQWNTTKGNTFKKNVFIRITAKRAIKLVILQALFLFPKTKIIVNCISKNNKSTPNFTFYFALFLNCPFWLIWCSQFLVGGNKCIQGGIILPKSISNLHLFTIIFELFGLNSTLHCSIVDNWRLSLGHVLNVKITRMFYDNEALKELAKRCMTRSSMNELTCLEVGCYRKSLIILVVGTFFGALVSLILVIRTQLFYKGTYTRSLERKRSPPKPIWLRPSPPMGDKIRTNVQLESTFIITSVSYSATTFLVSKNRNYCQLYFKK